MRVSLVDPSAFTPPYDRSLAAALARAGVEVELVTSRFAYGPVPRAAGYAVRQSFYRLAERRSPGSRARLALKGLEHPPRMLAEARRAGRAADVVHWQWVTAPAIDRLLVRPSGHPRLLTLHYPLPPSTDRRALRRQHAFLSSFDAVIAHTRHGAERLRGDVGLDPGRVHRIPHGPLDYLRSLPHEEPLPAELADVEEGTPVVLFFGLLRPYKGVDLLLEAFGRLEATEAELWIAGMPRMPLEPLRALAERVPGRVRFVPRFIADPEIPALLRRADLLVLPYREIEQSGVLYAGLAFGKPMILSDVGGFAEIGREHGVARLVPPGDVTALASELATLLGDESERHRLAAATDSAVAGEYSWDAIAGRTADLYRSLLARGR